MGRAAILACRADLPLDRFAALTTHKNAELSAERRPTFVSIPVRIARKDVIRVHVIVARFLAGISTLFGVCHATSSFFDRHGSTPVDKS
jgi:hypothetical protein